MGYTETTWADDTPPPISGANLNKMEAGINAAHPVVSVAALKNISTTGLINNDHRFVLGYYTAGDGGGGLFYWDSASTTADDAGLTIRPSTNPANGRWKRIFTAGDVRPEWWGAKGDNSTNDATAIQAAVNHVVVNGGLVRLSNRRYRITSTITFTPTGTFNNLRWGVVGCHSTILQATSNTPIFKVDDSFPNGFLFEGINFEYSTDQPAANTNAIAILCDAVQDAVGPAGVGTYNFTVSKCHFLNCFRGLSQTPSGNFPVWGVWMSGCEGHYNMSGALVYLEDVVVGQPNIHIQDCYIRRNDGLSAQEPSIFIHNAASVHIENVEVNGGQSRVFELWTCSDATIQNSRIEAATLAVAGTNMIALTNSNVLVDGVNIQSTNFTAATGNNQFCFLVRTGSRVEMRGVVVNFSNINSGVTVYLVDGSSSTDAVTSLSLSNLRLQSPVLKYLSTSDWLPSVLKYDSEEAQRSAVSGDRGDTSPTLTMTSFPVQRFATALTANRTVTLPSSGTFNGARFKIVRTGLGSFTLDVGGLKTLPSGVAAFAEVTHDGTAWRLSGYGLL